MGALVTGIIQSSSASVGILQALSATGVITYGSAIPIIMGQNIGTCVTALISSVGANKNARRAAMVHLYFNIIGVTVFLAGFYGLNAVVHFDFVNETIAAWGIAVVHSAFNIAATLILLPFANGLEKLAILTIPDDAEKESFALLDERLLNTPAMAVARARSATADMAELARVGVMQAMSLTHTWDDTLAQKVRDEESKVDQYEDALGTYLVKLSSRELNHADSQSVNTLLHTISDFERISDHSVNLLESAQEMHTKEINFSTDAREELQVLEDAVQDVLNRTTDAFRKDDLHLASKVEPLETVVDHQGTARRPPAGRQLFHRVWLRAGRPADQLRARLRPLQQRGSCPDRGGTGQLRHPRLPQRPAQRPCLHQGERAVPAPPEPLP